MKGLEMKDKRTKQDGHYLSDYAVRELTERHGWFEFADAQSDVSRAFANNAIHAFIEAAKEYRAVEHETGKTPRQLAEENAKLREQLETLYQVASYCRVPNQHEYSELLSQIRASKNLLGCK